MTAPQRPEPSGARDPGLQAERTSLAWQRTGTAGSALAASAMLSAAHLDAPWVLVGVTLISVGCAAAAALAVRSARPGRASPWTRLIAVAAIPVLLAVAGGAMALNQP